MFEDLWGLHEALRFYEGAQPVSPDGPFETVVAAASRVAWMVTPCDECGGTGNLGPSYNRGGISTRDIRPCPSCVGGFASLTRSHRSGSECA